MMSGVKENITIKNVVASKGFAFATSASSDNIFISAITYKAFGSPRPGQCVSALVKRSSKGFTAEVPNNWKAWQIGEDQLRLPNTAENSAHTLSFGCYNCQCIIVKPVDTFKLKDGSVWTTQLPTTLKVGAEMYNSVKQCSVYIAHCAKCSFNLGSIYLEQYEGCDLAKEFPCAKLTHLRESKNGAMSNGLVILGESKEEAEAAIRNLVLHEEVNRTNGVRMTQKTFDIVEAMKQLELATDAGSSSTNGQSGSECCHCFAKDAVVACKPCNCKAFCESCAKTDDVKSNKTCPVCRSTFDRLKF